MDQQLKGKTIAILATDGVELVELTEPRKALNQAGAKTVLISLKPGEIKSWKFTEWGEKIPVDLEIDKAKPENYDGLHLPGGVINPDKLRRDPRAIKFVRAIFEAEKPIASICHGPWMLIEADAVKGRTVTSWPSLQTDLRNAGATWVDEEVVTDQGIVTSRNPDDIPVYNKKMIEEFVEGLHTRST